MEDTADTTQGESEESGASAGVFGGLTPQEASKRAAETRRKKKLEREAAALDASRSFREKVGVGLAALDQREITAAIRGLARSGKPADLRALAVLADQAFGKPMPAPEDAAEGDNGAQGLSREARTALMAALDALEAPPEG